MKLWNDNSGKGCEASWFLKHVIVHDLQTREKFYFICEKWLALEKGDGRIERQLFIACKSQITELKYLMKRHFQYNTRDSYLWYSVWRRPVNSTFTRLDRVTCCFVWLYLSMLAISFCLSFKTLTSNFILVNLGSFNITLENVKNNLFIFCFIF